MRSIGLAMLLALFSAAPASAQDASPEAALARLEENVAGYVRAQQRLAALEAEYARGMNSRDLVGDDRKRVVAGIADAERELAAARAAHAELFEAARRAGVPWNQLDRYEALPSPPAEAAPDLEEDPDALEAESSNVDADTTGASEDPDSHRATSRDPE